MPKRSGKLWTDKLWILIIGIAGWQIAWLAVCCTALLGLSFLVVCQGPPFQTKVSHDQSVDCLIIYTLYPHLYRMQFKDREKPAKLYEQILNTYLTDKSLYAVDACSGSGSCGVACQSLGVKCLVLEKSQMKERLIRQRIGWVVQVYVNSQPKVVFTLYRYG